MKGIADGAADAVAKRSAGPWISSTSSPSTRWSISANSRTPSKSPRTRSPARPFSLPTRSSRSRPKSTAARPSRRRDRRLRPAASSSARSSCGAATRGCTGTSSSMSCPATATGSSTTPSREGFTGGRFHLNSAGSSSVRRTVSQTPWEPDSTPQSNRIRKAAQYARPSTTSNASSGTATTGCTPTTGRSPTSRPVRWRSSCSAPIRRSCGGPARIWRRSAPGFPLGQQQQSRPGGAQGVPGSARRPALRPHVLAVEPRYRLQRVLRRACGRHRRYGGGRALGVVADQPRPRLRRQDHDHRDGRGDGLPGPPRQGDPAREVPHPRSGATCPICPAPSPISASATPPSARSSSTINSRRCAAGGGESRADRGAGTRARTARRRFHRSTATSCGAGPSSRRHRPRAGSSADRRRTGGFSTVSMTTTRRWQQKSSVTPSPTCRCAISTRCRARATSRRSTPTAPTTATAPICCPGSRGPSPCTSSASCSETRVSWR